MRALLWRWMGFGDVVIRAYYCYRYEGIIYGRGRVLREDFVQARSHDRWLRNFINMVRRLMSYELPSKELEIIIGDKGEKILLDKEGFFDFVIRADDSTIQNVILVIRKENLDRYHNVDIVQSEPITTLATASEYGIISDIDDTILRTGVTSFFKWRLIINTLFLNPIRRRTFKDTVGVYQKLNNSGQNPFFYISNSPWNMFDYLEDYLTTKEFPDGKLLLRDINFNELKSKTLEHQNKYKEIHRIYTQLEHLNFVLIGDAGEYDADIYLAIANQFPKRTLAIYIRSVPGTKRNQRVHQVINGAGGNTPILFFTDTKDMESHAQTLGLLK